MRKFVVFFLVLILLGVFIVPPANSFAQLTMKKPLPLTQQNQATIVAITPNSVTLKQGEAVIVTADGKFLETVLAVKAIRNGQGVGEIAVKLVQPWPASRKIELKATANAPVGPGYQLRFIGKAGLKEFRINVPLAVFSLEVAGKKTEPLPQRTLPQPVTTIKPPVIVKPQPVSPKAEIIAFEPKSLRIEAGGEPVSVTIEGKNLDSISLVQVVRNGLKIDEISVKPVKLSLGIGKLELKAAAYAPIAKGYQLRIIGKVGLKEFQIDTPLTLFSMEVAGNTQRKGQDIILFKVDLMVFNPGDEGVGYEVGKPIYTHSRIRLMSYFKNIGNTPVDLRDVSWMVVEGPLLKERMLSNRIIEPGAIDHDILNYSGPGDLAAGTFTIKVQFDVRNKIDELSESNNSMMVKFTVQPSSLYSGQSNLKFLGVIPTIINAACGTMRQRQYVFDATVINAGGFPANIHGVNVIQADSPLLPDHYEGYFITLMPQQQKTIRFTATFSPGISQTLNFYTDKWAQLVESDESDNQFAVVLQVPAIEATELGDLVAEEAYFSNTPTPTTQQYKLIVKVKNLGPATLTLCPSMFMFTTVNAPDGLGLAGASTNRNVTMKPGDIYKTISSYKPSLPSGTFTIKIKLDPSDLILEANEANNEFSFVVTLPQDIRTGE